MIELPANRKALFEGNLWRWAILWKIEPTSGPTIRLTTHDRALTLSNNLYTPIGGMDASARQTEGQLRDQNFEARGVLESNAITFTDLRTGVYDEAKVTEIIVDWRYPWAGALYSATYWIVETEYDFEQWTARVEGLTRWLRPSKGSLYERGCRYTFGDSNCTFNLALLTFSGSVFLNNLPGSDARRVFWTNVNQPNGAFNYGYLDWLTGNNAGLRSEVKKYLAFGGQVELFLRTDFDIQVGDTFNLVYGCDKRRATCKLYANFDNFGGFPFLPGTLEALKTP